MASFLYILFEMLKFLFFFFTQFTHLTDTWTSNIIVSYFTINIGLDELKRFIFAQENNVIAVCNNDASID